MSDKAEKQAITKAEVINAMKTIRDWCESRDAIENACVDCPMLVDCGWPTEPCNWEVEDDKKRT